LGRNVSKAARRSAQISVNGFGSKIPALLTRISMSRSCSSNAFTSSTFEKSAAIPLALPLGGIPLGGIPLGVDSLSF